MGTGAVHVWPFHWTAWPPWSTAVQKLVVGHDTPAREDVVPNELGWVQDWPSHCERPPEEDMQNAEETQEMEETDPQSPLVPCHDWPSNAKAFPSASTAAQYPVGAQPTASRPLAPSTGTSDDQVWPFQLTTWSDPVGTAQHDAAEAHDTEMPPEPIGCPPVGTGPDHVLPSKE